VELDLIIIAPNLIAKKKKKTKRRRNRKKERFDVGNVFRKIGILLC
jgi:hypothetical protein